MAHQLGSGGTGEDDPEQQFSWLSEAHDKEHEAQLKQPKQHLPPSKPNPFVDDDNDNDNEEEEAFRWDDSKPLMGTGRLLLQDPEQATASSSATFPSQWSYSSSPPAPSQLIISVPLHPEPTSSSSLLLKTTTTTTTTTPISETSGGNGQPINYGSITATTSIATLNDGITNSDGSTPNIDDDGGDQENAPLHTPAESSTTATTTTANSEQPPQRPCYLQMVYAFESLAILTCLSWWLTEVLLPLLVLRQRALEETPFITIVLLSYVSALLLLLALVESRRPCACCCGLLQSPVLRAPIYRGFWYSLIGCIGMNLASDEYQRQLEDQDFSTNNNGTDNSLSFGWFWQLSWSSWLFLQVASSIMMMLIGWIYILAGLLCFACGECFERSRTEHEGEWTRYQQQQRTQQQAQTQSSKRPPDGKAKSK